MTPHDISTRSHSNYPTPKVLILHLFSSPHPASPHITPILLPPPRKSSYYTYSPPPTPQVLILHLFSSPHSTGPHITPILLPHPASPHITPILLPPPRKSPYYTYSPPPTLQVRFSRLLYATVSHIDMKPSRMSGFKTNKRDQDHGYYIGMLLVHDSSYATAKALTQ